MQHYLNQKRKSFNHKSDPIFLIPIDQIILLLGNKLKTLIKKTRFTHTVIFIATIYRIKVTQVNK